MSVRFVALLGAAFVTAVAASTNCVPDQTVDSQTYTSPDGVNFTITTSKCKPGSQVETRDVTRVLDDPLRLDLVERDASECTDPAICWCGLVPCAHTICIPSLAGTVQPEDCSILANAILATLKGTFFLAGEHSRTANYESCEFEVANAGLPGYEVEYCWDEFANLSRLSSQRCPAQQGSCEDGGFIELLVLFSTL